MALADILDRIESDAAAEAQALIASAEQRADAILSAAKSKAAAYTQGVVAAAERDARRDAETIVVNARLRGRDALVAARRGLIDEAMAAAAARLAALPDAEYASFLASRIAEVARGGETVAFGREDLPRSASIMAALDAAAPALGLQAHDAPAPFDRGALLEGSRVRVDLSLTSIVEDRRDDLELIIASELFGEGS